MKNNDTIYNIVVHVVNLLLLGAIGLLAFFSVVNISPQSKTPLVTCLHSFFLFSCSSCGQLITGSNTRRKNGFCQ